jgi:hypothetical protein
VQPVREGWQREGWYGGEYDQSTLYTCMEISQWMPVVQLIYIFIHIYIYEHTNEKESMLIPMLPFLL